MAQCRSCNEPIEFRTNAGGKVEPISLKTGESHFIDCPDARAWRRGPWRQPSLFDADEPGTEPRPEKDRYPS